MSGVYLSSLLEGNFDENVFVSKAFEANNLVEALKTVSEKLSELDASIYQHVSKNNSDLLSQAVELENFSNIVESVESRILGVSSNVKMIKQRLTKQYEHLLSQVTQIRRLGHIYDTLRNIHRISSTSKKLFESSDNLVLASECIEELDYAFSTVDWKGIDILEEYYENLEKEKDRVAKQVWELVQSSLDACEQSRLGVGLQAFEKLSVLPKIIQALVSDWQAEIEGAVKSAVDIEDINKKAKGKVISALTSTTPGKASLPSNGGQVAAFRNLLWTRLDQMVNLIERRLTQSRLLCVTLQKKRPSTGIPSSSATLASRLCSFLMEKADDPQEKDCCSAIIFVLSTEELNSDGDSVKTKLADLKRSSAALIAAN